MADRRRSPEPLAWLLFSIGGTVAALLVPVLLVLFGIAFPTGLLPTPNHAHLLAVLRHPATKIVLLGLCVTLLFHWAHRFRYTLYDGLQLKEFSAPIIAFCYGAAVLGSVAAAYLLLRSY
ncbi:fumarate reductase subunit FrdD [Saccharopolyspora sp. NPDC050389]|uniref:fumarate reductase subunit FrdD n=1 Tax=Saccharopolyspora sp. NPDC050389 TaxID=3155516 RepID=UPI0033CDC2E8